MGLQRLSVICAMTIVWSSSIVWSYTEHPGPRFRATKGEIWPKPQQQVKSDTYRVVIPSDLIFVVAGYTCDILENATGRFKHDIDAATKNRATKMNNWLSESQKLEIKQQHMSNVNYIGRLELITVNLTQPCEILPHLDMNESYSLEILPDGVDGKGKLQSPSIWGILRGLESLYQSMYFLNDKISNLQINVTQIEDYPRFPHRGLLLDTSRHYISKYMILRVLDGMSYNKLNVFHWHIVDDQSFPYVSIKFPTLSEKGAYNPGMVYTPKVIAEIIEYARMRGIRVIPEFDTPGHTRSWGEAFPKLLAQCYDDFGNARPGELGPINPANNETYLFMKELVSELAMIFKDKYIHLGGDEVEFECWDNNPEIMNFMNVTNMTTFKQLESYYIEKIVKMVEEQESKSIVWQEVFVNNVNIPVSTVVQIWYGNIELSMFESTLAGHKTLLSTCWYLDHLSTGGDWSKFYECDPLDFQGSDEQKKLVMGGEACMWSEVVDNTNVLSRIFPRASAVAEKLWSSDDLNASSNFLLKYRMEEQACRMNLRGIPAQPPSGPGYCF